MEDDIMYVDEDQIGSLQGQGSQILSDNNFVHGRGAFNAKDPILGVFELDFKPFLVQLQIDLLGLTYDARQKKYVKDPGVTELMPLDCSKKLINFLRAILFLNTPMTNLDEDRIKMSISSLQKSLDRMLFEFGYFFKVESSVLWYLSRSCGQQIENALYRAKDGKERELRASNINVQGQQHNRDQDSSRKSSLFPKFWGGLKKI